MPRYSSRVRSYSPSTSGVTSELGIVWSSSGGHTHDGVESSLIDGESYSLFDFRPTNRVSTIERSNVQERNREALKSFIVNTIKEDYIEFNNILLGPDVIGAQNIVAGSINSDLIAANTIVANNIAANTITTELLDTDAVQSLNYVEPGAGQVYSNAGSFLDLSDGQFITPGLRLYSNGDLYISNSVVIGGTTASTVVDGAAAGANSIPTGGAAADVNTGNTTVSGGQITANTITRAQLTTDSIQSSDYTAPSSGNVFSNSGSFLDLSGGNFISTGFSAYSNGSVYIASNATIGSTAASTVVSGAAAGANAIPTGGAAADVNTGGTTIAGTKITSNSITTSQIATDAIKSSNYDGPDSGEVFSDAGTFLDLSGGNFISRGFAAYSNGSVYISSTATIGSTTASTVVSGAAAGATSVQIGGAASDVNSGTTNISGGKVRTGDIESTGFVRGSGTYSTTGARFDLDTGDIIAPKFRLYSNGVIYATEVNLSGTINASGGTFSGDITANGTITGGTISGATITGSSLTTSGTSYITASGSTLTITNGDTAGFGSEIYMSGYLGYGGRIRSNNVLELRSDYSTDSWIRVGNASAETVIGYSSSSPIATFTSTLIAFAKTTNINASATINGDLDVNGIIYGDAVNSAAKIYHRNGGYVTFDVNGSNQLVVRNNDSTVVKTFVINHPVDSDKYLVHAAAEGPTADVFYRGESKIRNGECVVKLPDYFESLTEIDNRTVTLTPIYNGTKTGTLSVSRVVNGKFTVYSTDQIEDGQEFYWRVDAVRRGTAFDVEPDVGSKKLMGDGPYTYLV